MAKNDNKPAFVKRHAIVSGKEYARLLNNQKDCFLQSQIRPAVKDL